MQVGRTAFAYGPPGPIVKFIFDFILSEAEARAAHALTVASIPAGVVLPPPLALAFAIIMQDLAEEISRKNCRDGVSVNIHYSIIPGPLLIYHRILSMCPERKFAFVEVGPHRINLDHVSHWTDNGTGVDVYVYGQKIATLEDASAQKFLAAVEGNNQATPSQS